MMLTEKEARKLINLNPYGSIDNEIAERQFQVILRGFNCLIQDKSDMLYIADEVGLGKTYIALGIAALLRHFSSEDRMHSYKDIILVPKRNLQYKWVKEIHNFNKHNYLLECNIVKSVLGTSVGIANIHNKLEVFKSNIPSYEIYRNSSFSIATSNNFDWKHKLKSELPLDLQPLFEKGMQLYNYDKEIYLKRLFGFLLNISFPEIDLLIVDEAHNFKHGIGNHVSYRNQIVSRLMGIIKDEEDGSIFNDFPTLKERITQKVKKVIFLSATPIDNGLFELKNQLDCFLPNHRYKNSENINDELKESLNTFLIRGLMKIKLDKDGDVSRNMYRHEHRRGNVIKQENAKPQYIENNLEAIIIGLLQLKTLKHFNESNNKSFEIGMLAGFETFKTSSQPEEKEFENSNQNSIKSEDQDVIRELSESYFETFDKHLPHPKQDNLIKVLVDGFKNGNKSLVFVRRIASVIELERKITHEIENWHFSKLKKYINKNTRLKQLANSFEERYIIFEVEKVLRDLSSKIYNTYKIDFSTLNLEPNTDLQQLINDALISLYNSEDQNEKLITFKDSVKKHIGLKNIKLELKELSKELFLSHLAHENDDLDEENLFLDQNDDIFGYFFSSYFSSKRYIEGFNFRKRVATKDWFRYNFYQLGKKGISLNFEVNKLNHLEFNESQRTDAKRIDLVNEILAESITNSTPTNDFEVAELFNKKTFFNELLDTIFKNEFDDWLYKYWGKTKDTEYFFSNLNALLDLFQGVFRNGSGLLPAYIAECIDKDNFEIELIKVLKNSFPEVLSELSQIIIDFDKILTTNFSEKSKIQRTLYGQQPIIGVSGSHKRDINRVATQFRMPGYPYILITTDILKEGEDLHLYCKDIYHYGIAWNPSDMEQRTGRIDRINSSCYFDLKKDGEKKFDNALQVFYPYLADTLEVNQVAKVFNKMNDFIETFYDISIVNKKDTKASTDEIVSEIPKQIKKLLSSTYDYENFKGINNAIEKKKLEKRTNIGHKKDYLNIHIRKIDDLLIKAFPKFNNKPTISSSDYSVKCNINLNGRRAPLKINLIKGKGLGAVLYSAESIICRSNDLRSKSKRNEIYNYLKQHKLNFQETNNYLTAQQSFSLNEDKTEQLKIIKNVIESADYIEEKYLERDQDSF